MLTNKEREYIFIRAMFLNKKLLRLMRGINKDNDQLSYPNPFFVDRLEKLHEELTFLGFDNITYEKILKENQNIFTRLNEVYESVLGFPDAYKIPEDRPIFNKTNDE